LIFLPQKGEIYQQIFCCRCGEQAAIQNSITGKVISGKYFEDSKENRYCMKCFGVSK
jgi:hypothetical protein